MGLDQWFYKAKEDTFEEVEKYDDGTEQTYIRLPKDHIEICYFRKHHELNSWIGFKACPDELYDFNCIPIKLEESHITSLFNDLVTGELTSEHEHHNEELLSFIKKAFDSIAEGYDLYYMGWW